MAKHVLALEAKKPESFDGLRDCFAFSWLLTEPDRRKLHAMNAELLARASGGSTRKIAKKEPTCSAMKGKAAAACAPPDVDAELAELFVP